MGRQDRAQGKTGLGKQGKTGQGTTREDRAGHKGKQDTTWEGRAGHNKGRQGRAQQGRAGQGTSKVTQCTAINEAKTEMT